MVVSRGEVSQAHQAHLVMFRLLNSWFDPCLEKQDMRKCDQTKLYHIILLRDHEAGPTLGL